MSNPFLHVVCDYEKFGDLAWSEVMAALAAHLPADARLHPTTVGSFDTIGTGFAVAQLALADRALRPANLFVFANCAPRKDSSEPRGNNAGEGLLYVKLFNGVQITAVNSGFSLSFLKGEIEELVVCNVSAEGSQFRSRDIFLAVVGRMVAGDLSFLGEKLDPETAVPDAPEMVVCYRDSFGNLKTGMRAGSEVIAAFTPGQKIQVTVGGVTQTAIVSDGNFNVKDGELSFSPGSSGQGRKFYELFLRGGSAAELFDNPPAGAAISIANS